MDSLGPFAWDSRGTPRPRTATTAMLWLAVLIAVGCAWPTSALATLPQQRGAASLLSDANVTLKGDQAQDEAGRSVAFAGDVNGDGIDDVIVGAPNADATGPASGAAFVIFGQHNPTTVVLDDSGMPASQGFLIEGAATDNVAGFSVAGAGDVNGDGFDDVIVGAPGAAGLETGSGNAYVVFGSADPSTIQLSNFMLPASEGFLINGLHTGDQAGVSVSGAGDVNHDGLADVIVGASQTNANGTGSGAAYVVFGTSTATTVNLDNSALPADQGFVIQGAAAGNQAGASVAGASDVNGDGFADVIVGAPAAAGLVPGSGNAYVIFGSAHPGTVQLSNFMLPAAVGFLINGVAGGDQTGSAVAGAGDVNGDGLADVIVGGNRATTNGAGSGAAYVVFGVRAAATVDLSNTALPASEGFLIKGAASGNELGFSLAGAGDVNGDGIADVVVGAPIANSAYVVYGTPDPKTIDLSSGLAATKGFVLGGSAPGDQAGISVAGSGDIDGDRHADVIVGADDGAGNASGSGTASVLFGFGPASLSYPKLTGTQGQAVAAAAPTFAVGAGQGSFSVSPPLPAGLSLGPETGIVTGTPAVAGNGVYTVSLTDLTGTVTAPLSISIAASPPTPAASAVGVAAGIPKVAIPPSVKVASAAFHVRYRKTRAAGQLVLRGTASSTIVGTLTLAATHRRLSFSGVRFPVGAFTVVLRVPSTITPGRYRVTGSAGLGLTPTTATLAAPRLGIVERSYVSGPARGPAATTLGATSVLWAHFLFATIPAKGQAISTQWILPSGQRLVANARPRTKVVQAQVENLSGKPLVAGRWRCLVRVGNVVVATVSVRVGS